MSEARNLLNDINKTFGIKVDKNTALSGFYAFQGMLSGIAINDIWKFLNLPGNGTPVRRMDGTPVGDFDMDFLYQSAIGGLLVAAEFLFGVKHAAAFGGGLILGSRYANVSEKGHYIGNATVPFVG